MCHLGALRFCYIPRHENLSNDYHIKRLRTKPEHVGFHAVARERFYFLLVHKKFGHFVADPEHIYDIIAGDLSADESILVDTLFWETDPTELKREILNSHTASRSSSEYDESDWTHFLTPTERSWLEDYTAQWQERYSDMKDAVFVLNQNPQYHKTWTSRSDDKPSRLPTLCPDSYFLYTIALFSTFLTTKEPACSPHSA